MALLMPNLGFIHMMMQQYDKSIEEGQRALSA
jgi:hypothetical protein